MAKILKAERAGNCSLYYFPVIPSSGNAPLPSEDQGNRFERFVPAESPCDLPTDASSRDFGQSGKPVDGAYQKGFVDGKLAGYESGKLSILALSQTLESLVAELQAAREDVYREAEQAAVSLSLAISRKILHQEIHASPDVVVGIVRKTLEKIKAQRNIRVKVNPEDLESLENAKCDLADVVHHLEHLRFEADETIGRGGCLVETGLGEIDARIESQLKRIERLFADLRERRASDPVCKLPADGDTENR